MIGPRYRGSPREKPNVPRMILTSFLNAIHEKAVQMPTGEAANLINNLVNTSRDNFIEDVRTRQLPEIDGVSADPKRDQLFFLSSMLEIARAAILIHKEDYHNE